MIPIRRQRKAEEGEGFGQSDENPDRVLVERRKRAMVVLMMAMNDDDDRLKSDTSHQKCYFRNESKL